MFVQVKRTDCYKHDAPVIDAARLLWGLLNLH